MFHLFLFVVLLHVTLIVGFILGIWWFIKRAIPRLFGRS